MELDKMNMIQILSFDGRIVSRLLEHLDANHSAMYPLFYKIMFTSPEGHNQIMTPIEIALENNQIRALNSIINYCVKFQNKYSFSFLFENVIIELMNKGIELTPLFESDIFCHEFEFENWPAIHTDNRDYIMPYNGSKFQLNSEYKEVFEFLQE